MGVVEGLGVGMMKGASILMITERKETESFLGGGSCRVPPAKKREAWRLSASQRSQHVAATFSIFYRLLITTIRSSNLLAFPPST